MRVKDGDGVKMKTEQFLLTFHMSLCKKFLLVEFECDILTLLSVMDTTPL
jgi:hypothetical protein